MSDAALEAVKARYREFERRMGVGCGVVMMSVAGDRMRRLRDRQRAGLRVAHPEVDDNALTDKLINDGRISEEASADPKAVDAAISQLLLDYQKNLLRVTGQSGKAGLGSSNMTEQTRCSHSKGRIKL